MIVGKMVDGRAHLSLHVDLESKPKPDDVIYRDGFYHRVIGGYHVQTVQLSDDEVQPPTVGELFCAFYALLLSCPRMEAIHEPGE